MAATNGRVPHRFQKAEDLAKKAEEAAISYLTVTYRFEPWLGTVRKVKGEDAASISYVLDSDQRATTTTTKLYDWEAIPSLRALKDFKAEAKKWLDRKTLVWPGDGRLIKKTFIPKFEEKVKEYQEQLIPLAAAVQADRDIIIKRDRHRRGKAFQMSDYPDDLSKHIGLLKFYGAVHIPEELKEISDSFAAAEAASRAMLILGGVQINEQAFLENFRAMVVNLIDKLTLPKPGEKKVLREAAVENLQEFCSNLSDVMAWGDSELEELAMIAGETLNGLKASDLKHNMKIKITVREKLKEVAARLKEINPPQPSLPLVVG
jgi:hypothetical protein